MKQWVCVRIGRRGSLECIEYKPVVIMIAYTKGNDASVIQV